MRIIRTLALTGFLVVNAAAMAGAATKTPAKKAADTTITCPIMHSKVAKSKAIKVTASNGKSTYVCCKACVEPAKKMLLTKKSANDPLTCPVMKHPIEKDKAIKVTAANGKSTYVCCKGCIEPAKKQLMAKK